MLLHLAIRDQWRTRIVRSGTIVIRIIGVYVLFQLRCARFGRCRVGVQGRREVEGGQGYAELTGQLRLYVTAKLCGGQPCE